MASPRGTKRALSEEAPEEPEEEQVSSESESEEEPFADGPAPDLFSPSKEQKLKPTLPQRVAYIDRPIIVAGQLLESARLCSLPHARAGKAQYFVQKSAILEIHRVRREPGSWFAGDAVIEDGTLYVATEVDPLFVLIPVLEKSRKKDDTREGFYVPFAQILAEDDQFSAGLQHAHAMDLLNNVHIVCDTRTVGNDTLYRLSDQKLLAWLEAKVLNVASRLMAMDPALSQSAAVASNVNLAHKAPTQEEANVAAVSLISDYISTDWLRRVYTSLGISEPAAAKPPSAYLTIEPKPYRRTSEKETVAKPKPPAAIRRLESVDKRGMAAITSFFKPKHKPS